MKQLPLEPSSDPIERIKQLEDALEWTLQTLSEMGVGYMPGDVLLEKRFPPTPAPSPATKR